MYQKILNHEHALNVLRPPSQEAKAIIHGFEKEAEDEKWNCLRAHPEGTLIISFNQKRIIEEPFLNCVKLSI